MKLKLVMAAMVLSFGMNAFADGITILRCKNFEKLGMINFQITLAEEVMVNHSTKKVTNGAEVKAMFNNGSQCFATEDSTFNYSRTPGKGSFYIGDQTFIRLDRAETEDGYSYSASITEDRMQYGLRKGMSSSCVVTGRE